MTTRGDDARHPPTLESVAALAGVSRQTVSNALHHPGRLSSRTREKVMRAVAESGYRPSLPARQLALRRAHAIAVRADRRQDGISGLVLDEFFHGLAESGSRSGLRVVLYPQQADQDAELAVIEELLHVHAADAVVLTATGGDDRRPAHLAEAGLTFCAFGRPWGHDEPPHDWVDVDGAHGTRLAVRHLLERGARRIGFLGWPPDSATGVDRRRGWFEALAEAGVPPGPEATSPNDASAAEVAARALLTGPTAADAVVCASDTLALGAYRAAHAVEPAPQGRRPVVVGFDDTPVAGILGFPSVTQPIGEVAGTCLELLLPRLEGLAGAPRGVLLKPTLHVPT